MAREFQIGRKLGFMHRQCFFDRLGLHYHQPADNQVHPEASVDPMVPVNHRQHDLPLEGDVPCLKLKRKALLIDRFEKSRTKRAVNSKRRIYKLAGKQIMLRRGFSHLGALALNWNGTIDSRREQARSEITNRKRLPTHRRRHESQPNPPPALPSGRSCAKLRPTTRTSSQ